MRSATLALVSAVVIAGCAASLPGVGTGGPPSAAWTDGERLDAEALARAHFEALREAGSFTVVRSERVVVRGDHRPEGYHPSRFVRERVDLEDGRYLRQFAEANGPRSERYISPIVVAVRREACAGPECPPEHEYHRRPTDGDLAAPLERYRSGAAIEELAALLSGWGFAYAGTVERSGETLYRYTAERVATGASAFAEPPRGNATLLVTGEGVIRRIEIRYEGPMTATVDGETRSVEATRTVVLTYRAVGETNVERPGWYDQGRAG